MAILSSVLLLPVVGTLIAFFIPAKRVKVIKMVGLYTSLATFLLSLFLWILFDKSTTQFQFVEHFSWLSFANINIYIGLDGVSIFFVLLTTFLIPICFLAGWDSIKTHIKEYIICFLLLESFLNAVFSVLDIVVFYIFFESVLIPMFIIIGVWGSRERKIHAAYQFFLYTLMGSVLFLFAIMIVYFESGTTDISLLGITSFSEERQRLLWLEFFASFAVKVPLVPFHIWLPEAHVEAPTAGSVILAGILLKLGGYGFLRFSIPIFPEASRYYIPLIYTIGSLGIIYASLTTLRQIDLKKIIAYSSVAHMSLVILGIFSINIQGLEGGVLLMLSHGLVSSALFLCVGVLYDRHHTRLIEYYGGVVNVMPVYATLFLFFTCANMSFPGTSSFVGEILVILGLFQSNSSIAFLAVCGAVVGAAYSIWLYNRISFGPFRLRAAAAMDIQRREFVILAPLAIVTLLMGVYPELFLDYIHSSTSFLL